MITDAELRLPPRRTKRLRDGTDRGDADPPPLVLAPLLLPPLLTEFNVEA